MPKKLGFCCYILYSEKHHKYYIGQTSDLTIRLESHNVSGVGTYTCKYRPWTLMVSLETETRKSAIQIERYLKKKPRIFLRRVIEEVDLRYYILERFK